MSTLSAAKALLEADSTLLTTATGGVWDYDESGRLGLNRTTTPGAFDSNGIVKPCVLLKLRTTIPDYVVADDANQLVSAKDNLEIWLYADNSYSAIETMKLRVYALLQAVRLSGTFTCLWAGDTQPFRDTDLDAFGLRSDYTVTILRSV